MLAECSNCGKQHELPAMFCCRCGEQLPTFVDNGHTTDDDCASSRYAEASADVVCNPPPITAELLERTLICRTLLITCPEGEYELVYDGRGVGSETICVNGVEVARRSGWGPMSRRYEFHLGEHRVAFSVAVPKWAELLFPVTGLSFVRLEIDGLVVYQEGEEPGRTLRVSP